MERFINRHVKHISDTFALVQYRKRFTIVARTVAFFARNINVGQEVHFNFQLAVAFAHFTASALGIKREATRPKTFKLRFRRRCIQIANVIP